MRLVAIHTIRRGAVSSALKLARREQFLPGAEFDASDDEGERLIEAGVARRKTREVIDDDAERPARRRRRSAGAAAVGSASATDDGDGDDADAGDAGDDDQADGDDGDEPDAAGN